jgi:hypothetical protein
MGIARTSVSLGSLSRQTRAKAFIAPHPSPVSSKPAYKRGNLDVQEFDRNEAVIAAEERADAREASLRERYEEVVEAASEVVNQNAPLNPKTTDESLARLYNALDRLPAQQSEETA